MLAVPFFLGDFTDAVVGAGALAFGGGDQETVPKAG